MRKSPNSRLTRISDAFLPAAMMVVSALPDSVVRFPADFPLLLFAAWFAVALFSLFASRGLRIAFARQPAIRRVRGSVKCSLLLTLAGGAIAAGASRLIPGLDGTAVLPLVAAGCLMNIEHIFYEYMYAIGDCRSATLSRGLSTLFIAAGMMLESPETSAFRPFLVGAAALSALVAFVISLTLGDGARGKTNGELIRCAPSAALQTSLYPAAAAAFYFLFKPEHFSLPFFAGLTLYELCRTPFRRSPSESRAFNKALLIAGIAAALVGILFYINGSGIQGMKGAASAFYKFVEEIPTICAMVFAAAACGFALYGNIRKIDD